MTKKIIVFFSVILSICPAIRSQVELLGEITAEQILDNFPDWQNVVASYNPHLETIARLQAISEPVTVEIFLGTWCSDSRQHVSAYFKIMEMVQNPLIRTTYIGLPRDKEARRPLSGDRDIQKIPTFIVSVQNQEKGRIIETPQVSVEEDLWRILQDN